MNFPSHLGPAAFFFPPLTVFGAFFYANNLLSATFKPETFFLLCLIELWSQQTGWSMFKARHISDSHAESVHLLFTEFEFQGICRHFIFFILYSGFFSYTLFIIKIITRQKEMAGGSQYAVTERRTCTLKNMTGCGLKHRLNFQTWHFQGKCWNAGGG